MKIFLKNISDSAIRVRSLGEKISVEAGEVFEVTGEEFENHTTLYPKFFEQASENVEVKTDDETPKTPENPDDNSDEKDDETPEKPAVKKTKTKNTEEK